MGWSMNPLAVRARTMPGVSDAGDKSNATRAITRDDVAHVARLARLDLNDEELERFTGQLAAVLAHAEDVAALDLSPVAPMAHPLPLQNVLRSDEVRSGADRDEVLAQAPAAESNQFRVPPILGDEP